MKLNIIIFFFNSQTNLLRSKSHIISEKKNKNAGLNLLVLNRIWKRRSRVRIRVIPMTLKMVPTIYILILNCASHNELKQRKCLDNKKGADRTLYNGPLDKAGCLI